MSKSNNCPQCGSADIYTVTRKPGDKYRALGRKGTGYARYEGDYFICTSLHQEHSCRSCQKLWGTKLNNRVRRLRDGHVGKVPTVPFRVEVMLPIHFCGECNKEYTVFLQAGRIYEDKPSYCPYCGVKDPGPSKVQRDWLSKLREDSLKALQSEDNPVPPGQTDPDPSPCNTESGSGQ